MQGGQEALESPNWKAFLNLQYKAGPQTAKADTTAKITRQHLRQAPDRRDISHPDLPFDSCFFFFVVFFLPLSFRVTEKVRN